MDKKFWQLLLHFFNKFNFTLLLIKSCWKTDKKSSPRLGFTVTEMILVIAIVGLIAGLTLANYRAHEQQLILETESQKLVSVLKQIQMMALSKPIIDSEPPKGGYGFYWTANSYFTFADIYPLNPNYQYDTGQDKIIQNFNFPPHISAQANWQNLVFKPPKAEIYLNGSLFTGTETIVLTHSQTGKTKTIRFNGLSGRIEIQ